MDVLELCVQRPLILGPVGEDVSHGAAVPVEAQVEAVGVDLRTICDLKHRLEANPFLPCIKKHKPDDSDSKFVLLTSNILTKKM